MSIRTFVLLLGLLTPLAQASEIIPGNRLPDLGIAQKGELVLNGDEVGYRAVELPAATWQGSRVAVHGRYPVRQ